ncbi:RICIN domain-containing protein [Streptomyces sp. NPDC015125]|uniref:RICIN domain-containing protein n=1 Tax=Streptomyces sp. NPDC015125 TaxID=3364938 RepID=UPI0036F93190
MNPTLLHRRTHPAARLIATFLAACCVALGVTVSPLGSGVAHAADCTDKISECMVIAPKNDVSKRMNVQGSGTGNGDKVITYASQGGNNGPAPNEQWHLSANKDGTAQIVNNNSKKCVDLSSPTTWGVESYYLAYQWDCGNTDGQKFYTEPTGDSKNMIRLRQASSSKCLTFVPNDGNGGIQLKDCASDDNQVWATDVQDNSLRELAATYAVGKCGTDSANCDIDGASATYARGNPVCVAYFHNGDDAPTPPLVHTITETVADAKMTGQQTTVGGTAGVSATFASATFKAEFNKSWQTSVQDTKTNTTAGGTTYSTAPVKPHHYAYILATPMTKTYTGKFTFNPKKWNEWTYNAGSPITVPVPADDQGNATLIDAGSAPDSDPKNDCGGQPRTFTGSGGSTDVPPGTEPATPVS